MKTITAGGIFVRFLLAFALVACTWNPTRYNFVQWALAQWDANAAIVFFVGEHWVRRRLLFRHEPFRDWLNRFATSFASGGF